MQGHGKAESVEGWDTPPQKILKFLLLKCYIWSILTTSEQIFNLACNNNQINNCATKCLKCIDSVLYERH